MPRIKKPRNKGTTYKLVPRSYGESNGEDQGPLWVSEAEFYRQHQSAAAPQEDDNAARRQFNMYAVAANAEFNDERRRGRRLEGEDEAGGVYDDYEEHVEGGEYEGEYNGEEEEEGEWIEGDWEEEEEEEEAEVSHPQEPLQKAEMSPSSAPPPALVSSYPSAAAASPSDVVVEEEEQEEKLFDDEVECEVTDDFLRQLVFGGGGVGEGDESGSDSMVDGDDWDALDDGDAEMWRLLTDEEKAAIKASRQRGTARRRRVAAAVDGEEGGLSRTHAADGTVYPVHDTSQRALDRQFTEMMREFDADARLNDAYVDDPRTHGALPVDNYMTALEEFVAGRAGVDVETAEPHKNKGLIQQLKYLSHHVGAFDSDARGVYMTTILPEKQQRFVEEFQKGTEEIRRAARMRVTHCNAAVNAGAVAPSSDPAASPAFAPKEDSPSEEEEEEGLVVMEVKSKADRLDCETAVSAHSTYHNQPNVIQAPRRSAQARRVKSTPISRRDGVWAESHAEGSSRQRQGGTDTLPTTVAKGSITSPGAAPSSSTGGAPATTDSPLARKGTKVVQVRESTSDSDSEGYACANGAQVGSDVLLTVRRKDETKEEKKMRRQAVKIAQRERRQAKSALKHTYKEVEVEELKRSSTSQAARRTVHFM
ncbi:hypothetical protein JKF63_00528 [Porcisia hertigi]|uniref:Protein LTV1 homolog n=1 Tax=Porcisia hertigi TaxID=2761500 RepID=A0A836I9Q8_9TRYP|nr:hypothetical protein JKF63_00528 [Porcisia hertigi]